MSSPILGLPHLPNASWRAYGGITQPDSLKHYVRHQSRGRQDDRKERRGQRSRRTDASGPETNVE
ncbi:hypothetical protein [Haloferax sp. ATB1]|uniref:hypothetical protein n=1 Tax=Haloferax sp. ATB1 TaxID=1508454 RepID=UPI000FE14B66|nr:hypothetical protein [Haloferax sp. ATB1]